MAGRLADATLLELADLRSNGQLYPFPVLSVDKKLLAGEEIAVVTVRPSEFNDRVEVQSPGGPYGQVTIENFGRPGLTDYRNPTLAEAMRALGYVQRFGVGIQAATHALAGNGNAAPEFAPFLENVLVVVRSRS